MRRTEQELLRSLDRVRQIRMEQEASRLEEPDEDDATIVAPTRSPDEPTGAVPGTDEKIKVLRERYERGILLYHPLDAGGCTTIPAALEDRTYTATVPGLQLRSRVNKSGVGAKQDFLAATKVNGIKITKRFKITEYDEAVEFVEGLKRGVIPGVEEIYENLLG